MRNDATAPHGRGLVPRAALALLLTGTALFLAAQNAVLLVLFAPAFEWPAEAAPLAVALRVARLLFEVLAPWIVLGFVAVAGAAAVAWLALRGRREVRHV
jgi:hypothetical protein